MPRSNPKHRPPRYPLVPPPFHLPMSQADWDKLCHRCGQCCVLPDGTPCQYFYRDAAGVGVCDLYPHHVGTVLADFSATKKVMCCYIWTRRVLPPGCAYTPWLAKHEKKITRT